MQDLPDLIKSYIDAYNRKDVEGMLNCLSDDVVFQNISAGEITAQTSDKQSLAEMARFGAGAFESRNQNVVNAITVATTTLVEIEYSAVVAIDLPNGWKAGQSLAFAGASAFIVRNGAIVSIIDES